MTTATGASAGTNAGASGDSVGAAECDEVLKEAAAPSCKDKPGMVGITGNREQWKLGLSNAATKDSIVIACKGAMLTVRAACGSASDPVGSGSATPGASGSAATVAAAEGSVGDADCDAIIKEAESCPTNPAATSILGNRENWKRGFSNGMSKGPTLIACKAAGDALKTAGCGAAGGPGGSVGGGQWDGKSPFSCAGNENVTITGVTANIATGPAMNASGNCAVTFKDCNITSDKGLEASGNAKVTLDGGELKTTNVAIDATGNAHVDVKGTKVTGKVTASGNGKVSGVPMSK